jgi:hypothetical protein
MKKRSGKPMIQPGTEAGITKPLSADWDAAPFKNIMTICLSALAVNLYSNWNLE